MQASPVKKSTKQLAGEATQAKHEWVPDSACADMDTSLWFSSKESDIAKAKAICFLCPVQDRCLELALLTKEAHGIWGGLDEKERSKLWRKIAGRSMAEAISKIVVRNKTIAAQREGS